MDRAIFPQLEACKTLPTLPAVATEIVSLSRRDDIDIAELSRVVERDPAIATKLLRTSRSAVFLTRAGAPTTISQAVMRLGANAVMTLALSFSLTRLRGSRSGFDYASFWKRMLLSGTAARSLAPIARCNADEAFLAGMFQDIGVLALHEVLSDEYAQLLAATGRDHLRLERLERETFGVDHREVGAWLAHRWQLPPYVEHATRGSHNPHAPTASEAFPGHAAAVSMSGFIAEIWLTSSDRVQVTRQAAECARMWLGMSGEAFAKLLSDVGRTVPELSRLFEIPVDERALQGTLEEARQALARVSLKTAESAFKAEATADRLAKEKDVAETQARVDALTGLFNRGHFDTQLERAVASARELGRPLSLVFFDLDHFKSVNDTHGHQVGDAVLQAVGRVVSRCIRQLDIAVRYGGEEFAVILPATDRAGAKIAAERLRKLLEKQDVLIGGGRAINVTASFGVATMDESFQVEDPAELVGAADACVYGAKHAGRNRVLARAG